METTTVRTNLFRVTNEDTFKKLIQNLICDGGIRVFEQVDKAGNQRYGLGFYSTVSYIPYPSQVLDSNILYYDEDKNEIPKDQLDNYTEVYDADEMVVYNRYMTDHEIDYFIEAIQGILPDGEVFVWIESGCDDVSDVWSDIGVVTNQKRSWQYSGTYIQNKAQEMTGDKNYELVW